MSRLTAEQIKNVIQSGIDENGQFTVGYLRNFLSGVSLTPKDFEVIAQIISEALLNHQPNSEKQTNFPDEKTVDRIMSIIERLDSGQEKLTFINKKDYPKQKNTLMMALSLGVHRNLSFNTIKK
ncbi:MAG: hypothetical protein ACM3SY_14675 [Candidatus Omnitrophota bacterium]